ncbi:hypothetical protein BD626DRAFT_573862 [Schizophyllum amplum]|uniref:Uncharacterized protein n=1 Tax=Schizophyllum amplum TaxID=97359 RepID=A0A550BZU2_9AGAR|nr:hypothetical protein BD626DRAFT_573862 [Auriculariopsis ampla]
MIRLGTSAFNIGEAIIAKREHLKHVQRDLLDAQKAVDDLEGMYWEVLFHCLDRDAAEGDVDEEQ